MNILYLLGCLEGESKRYRVYNLMEALSLSDTQSQWCYEIDEYIYDKNYLKQFDIVVLFRSGYSERIKRLRELLTQLEIPMIYDIDDLVFDEAIVNQVYSYQVMDESQKVEYIQGVRSMHKTLMLCDYVTASTPFLCHYLQDKFGKIAWHIPNGINIKQLQISEGIEKESSEIRFIGYLSGSKTHERDFEQVAVALNKVLTENNNVFLKIIGHLDVDKFFPGLQAKIIKLDFMNWEDLMIEMSNLYINLAPLEIESIFSHAKSELKYFEAATCKVPTIASPTDTFGKCIKNGENGLLATTVDEWYESINSLLMNQQLRDIMGEKAYKHVKSKYTPRIIDRIARRVYSDIITVNNGQKRTYSIDAHSEDVKETDCLNISWIVPQPFEGSGGHRNIFRTIKYLASFGHNLKVYINPDNHRFKTSEEVNNFITEHFMDLNAEVIWWAKDITECDVLFATHWSTAYIVDKNRDKAKLHCYFIQDFEPYFYSMGYEYVISYNTYKMGLYPITSGPWPLTLLKREFGITEGNFFRFPIDREIYYSTEKTLSREKQKILFFARPDMPRRCYHLGVGALQQIKAKRPDVEIVFYGAKSEKYENIPFEFTNLGMLPKIEDLGDLYRSATIGICFSTTNPSLVPYEMMACGCPVVDLDFNDNEVNYGSRENCILVEANENAITDAILKALDNTDYLYQLIKNGREYCNIFPTEIEMVKLIEGYIKEQYLKVLEG